MLYVKFVILQKDHKMYYSNTKEFELSRLNHSTLFTKTPIDFEALKEILEIEFQSEIVAFINQYYSSIDRGTINLFKVDDDYKVTDALSEIIVKCDFIYDVQYYSGCKDLDSTDEDQSMTITIKISKSYRTIEIVGDPIYTRDPDEY